MKRVLILYARNTQEVLNRQSALGSYIFCLAGLLEQRGAKVWINGLAYSELQQAPVSQHQVVKSSFSFLKNLIPARIIESKRDQMVLHQHQQLIQSLEKASMYDEILEFYSYLSLVGYTLSKKWSIPYSVVFDAPVLEEYEFFHGSKKSNKDLLLKNQELSLKGAKKVVVYSSAVKEMVCTLGCKADNVDIHQNIDFTRFEFGVINSVKEPIKIGFIGSFLKWHRVDLLVQVFEQLCSEGYQLELWLIGKGMEFESVRKRVERSQHAAKINLPGYCDYDKLTALKQYLDIGVMPGSNWYGAPNKIFEYGAAGMAVIAPDTPTIQALFTKNEVMFFKWDDQTDFYQKLKALITNKAQIQDMALQLQNKIRENYSAEKTQVFYQNLLDIK